MRGRFQVRKKILWTILIAIYVVLPWIPIGGRPAVHFDIPGRTAALFGQTFTNQDFYLLFFLVSGLGFALFVVTSLWGRIWCGYACPQTVFLEGMFRPVERWIEGSRDVRIRRNLGPWTFDKAWRKGVKHLIFVGFAFLTAHVFLAYFIPPRELVQVMTGDPHEHWAAFLWVMIWTGILYFDYAWFREQTCIVICPYGRAQSALIDADTMIIGYDESRGEPRSKKSAEGGDCIDCFRCVAVCPTGIDIREGLQMECVGCANCIDACDEIMDRTGRSPGLIRYDSQHGFEGKRRSFFRPRTLAYAALGLLGLAVFGFTAARRSPFELHVLRTKGLPYVLEEAHIRNVFTFRVQNKTAETAVYRLEVVEPRPEAGVPELLLPQKRVEIAGLADESVPLIVRVPRDVYEGPFPVVVTVADSTSGRQQAVEFRFRGP